MRVQRAQQWLFYWVPGSYGLPWVLHLGPFYIEGVR